MEGRGTCKYPAFETPFVEVETGPFILYEARDGLTLRENDTAAARGIKDLCPLEAVPVRLLFVLNSVPIPLVRFS